MPATAAKTGYGTLLKRGDGSGNGAASTVYTAISELKSLSGPTWKLDVVDATHTASPNSYRERIAALLDAGEVTMECAFLNDATQSLAAGVLYDMDNKILRNLEISFPVSTPIGVFFTGFFTGFEVKSQIDAEMMVSVKVSTSGRATFGTII